MTLTPKRTDLRLSSSHLSTRTTSRTPLTSLILLLDFLTEDTVPIIADSRETTPIVTAFLSHASQFTPIFLVGSIAKPSKEHLIKDIIWTSSIPVIPSYASSTPTSQPHPLRAVRQARAGPLYQQTCMLACSIVFPTNALWCPAIAP